MSKYTATIFEQNLLHCVVASTAVSLYVALHYSWIGYTHSWSWMSHTFFPRLFSGLSRGFCCNAPHYSLLLCMYVLRWKENSPHNSYCTNWFSTYLLFFIIYGLYILMCICLGKYVQFQTIICTNRISVITL